MFELYMLSIVNAGILTGYSLYKLSTDWTDVMGCKRLLASVMGYFIHDFIAVRSTWREDIPTVIHHVFGIALVAGAFRVERAHKLVPRFAIIEVSLVATSVLRVQITSVWSNRTYSFFGRLLPMCRSNSVVNDIPFINVAS